MCIVRLLAILCIAVLPVTAPAQSEVRGETSSEDGRIMIGAGIGMPAGASLIAGYDFGPIALRATGGGWAKGWYGAQGDVAINLNRGMWFAHGVSIVMGRFGSNPVNAEGEKVYKSQHYVGVTYDMYLAGFFLQAGLAFGKGDYPTTDGMFQFGYLYTF